MRLGLFGIVGIAVLGFIAGAALTTWLPILPSKSKGLLGQWKGVYLATDQGNLEGFTARFSCGSPVEGLALREAYAEPPRAICNYVVKDDPALPYLTVRVWFDRPFQSKEEVQRLVLVGPNAVVEPGVTVPADLAKLVTDNALGPVRAFRFSRGKANSSQSAGYALSNDQYGVQIECEQDEGVLDVERCTRALSLIGLLSETAVLTHNQLLYMRDSGAP